MTNFLGATRDCISITDPTRLVTENASSSYLGQTAKFVDIECQEAFLSTWYRLILFVFKFKAILASDL